MKWLVVILLLVGCSTSKLIPYDTLPDKVITDSVEIDYPEYIIVEIYRKNKYVIVYIDSGQNDRKEFVTDSLGYKIQFKTTVSVFNWLFKNGYEYNQECKDHLLFKHK